MDAGLPLTAPLSISGGIPWTILGGILWGVLGLAAGAALVLALRRGRTGDAAVRLAELGARVAQFTETAQTAQEQLTRRLIEQERALNEQLGKVGQKLAETVETSSTRNNASLTELKERLAVIDAAQKNIAELSSQVIGLQDILADTKARGSFGEMLMQEVVRDLLPASLYDFEVTLTNRTRVDCLLRLPGPLGPVGIDSKFPVQAYKAVNEAGADAAVEAARRLFATEVKKQVKDVATKYILPGETVDAAFMFVPSEAIFAELHAHHLDIVREAQRARVYIVSPTTLWAVLNTVRAVMKDVQMREQAHVIQAEVLKMLKDVGRLTDRVGSLEKHFEQARDDIGQIRISADKVSNRGEKITGIRIEEDESRVTALPTDPRRAQG